MMTNFVSNYYYNLVIDFDISIFESPIDYRYIAADKTYGGTC